VSAIVVDASVGLKWFLPEIHWVEARQWRDSPNELHTLAVFFDIEIANALWKKVQRGEISSVDAAQITSQLPALPAIRHAENVLVPRALDLAQHIQRTVYDSLYLALSIQLGGRMVTADQRLYNSISATSFAKNIAWVADFIIAP
jgi:predicted nucleic acid-binding protein